MKNEVVSLKNGSEETLSLVNVTMHSLQSLFDEKPMAVYELCQVCRNPEHKPWGDNGKDLAALSLLSLKPDGSASVHDSIRNVVLSAVSGGGLFMTLGNPIEEAKP